MLTRQTTPLLNQLQPALDVQKRLLFSRTATTGVRETSEAKLGPSIFSPLEQLLLSGGDTRLDVARATGRNRYDCWPRPTSAIPFGSCTSSTISPRGLAAAAESHRQICGSSDSRAAAYAQADAIRQRVAQLLALPDGIDVALGP